MALSLRHALGIAILSLLVAVALRRDSTRVDGNQDASFKLVDLPGKGKGLIATRDITQGELLVKERPLFRVPLQTSSSPSQLIWASVQELDQSARKAFMNLSYVNLPKEADPQMHPEEVALAIFQTNAVSAGDAVGIFPRMARLNHGCAASFNSMYTWREDEGVLVVHALKNISKGQVPDFGCSNEFHHDILTGAPDNPKAQRRAYLAERYGFECKCSVCSLPGELSRASDDRLSRMETLYGRFSGWGVGEITGVEAVETAHEIWKLGGEEGYWSERGRLGADAVWVAAAHADRDPFSYEAVKEWAAAAIQWYGYEIGADSKEVIEMRRILAEPSSHRAWRSRGSEKRSQVVRGCSSSPSTQVCRSGCIALTLVPSALMAPSQSDVFVLAVGVILAAVYLFRDQVFSSSAQKSAPVITKSTTNGSGNPRDFITKMKEGKKRIVIFYGSQTGTAEEYAIRIAKEAKAKFGLASLVCDPEEYDFENLDQLPEDCAAFFVVATYGEGEPTDNAVQLMQNLQDESFEFSNGGHTLPGLKYVVFSLGNRTYEHFNLIGRQVDTLLTGMGGTRIGERGEGDDDKSMEEDYLEWKDGMWEAFAAVMGVEEGQGGDSPDFVVHELESHPPEKVYLGKLLQFYMTRVFFGVAPFRGFVQERVAFARRTIEKNGPDALADWGRIWLFYGCRRSTEDFLYKDEWPQYEEELQGKFALRCAFSRETFKPDGSKIYVQDLIWEEREQLAEAILNGKGYVYICGEAKNMSKQVEEILAKILGQAKGGSAEVEGAAEVKLLKERSRLLLDVWS
ncbi:hypothetical protein M378DRAFT_177150 [Amanita muscaria Koide BX008]|uniref:NADPH--hemoprotein reductase n=1 Tax=Amanita muscaria (strain Koide BX008) TaxID=946122 RepID=A0A0C2XES0_AMAMK|nr:hypothetical protein M378DRAFT_177150 [Amanita muscaria Koide BX008]